MTLALEIALIAIAAVGAAICVALVPVGVSRRPRRAPPREPSAPGQLVELERLVGSASASALQLHAYLRPLLAEVAATRLAARGVTLERMADEAGVPLLGDRLWELVRPGRPFPEDRRGPGLSTDELASMLDTLERL
jgi:hypothetical protein